MWGLYLDIKIWICMKVVISSSDFGVNLHVRRNDLVYVFDRGSLFSPIDNTKINLNIFESFVRQRGLSDVILQQHIIQSLKNFIFLYKGN